MNIYSVFCFHLGCGLGLYLLHAIQMLLRRQNYEYFWSLSALAAMVVSTSFLFSVSSVVWRRDRVLVEDSLLYPKVGWVKIWRSHLSRSSQHCYEMERIQSQPFDGQQSSKTVFFNSKLKRLGHQPVCWPLILCAIKLEAQFLAKWRWRTMPCAVLGN